MRNDFLFALDVIFCFYGGFWAGLLFFTGLSKGLGFLEWLSVFSLMALFFYPLIRKLVEILSKMSWEDFKYVFKENYKDRAKKRWEY